MVRRQRILVWLLALMAVVAIGLVIAQRYCPAEGLAFTEHRRKVHRVKNRTDRPKDSDFDPTVTLANLLNPGDDSNRWATAKAARLEGYVVSLASAGVELANCYAPCRRDLHINIALRPDAPLAQQVVVEVTPAMRKWAATNGWDWSEKSLKTALVGHWCVFEGWLFFDLTHAPESENIAPGRKGNWRATAWELHPVTNFRVVR
jgi:hypothetical protein